MMASCWEVVEFDGLTCPAGCQAAALLIPLQAWLESRLCCGLTGYRQDGEVVLGSFPPSAAWGDVAGWAVHSWQGSR